MSPRRVRCATIAALLSLWSSASGCHATETFEPSAAGVLVTAEPLQVTLANNLRGWEQTVSTNGTQRSFRLGKLFRQLFPAQDGRAFLSPIAASLDSRWSVERGAWEARTTFALTLQIEGVRHDLSALGEGASPTDPREAEHAAIEQCMAGIYAQAAALLAGKGV